MKKIILTLVIVFFSECFLLSQIHSNKKLFVSLLDNCNLEYHIPASFKETPVRRNGDLVYQFAIKHTTKDFEIRYSIFPLNEALNLRKDTNVVLLVDPNKIFSLLMMTNIINLSGNGNVKDPIKYFESDAVKKEFNADAGEAITFPLNSEFGKGYKFCKMIVLHRDNIADVFITYLYNTNKKSEFKKIYRASCFALKFKK